MAQGHLLGIAEMLDQAAANGIYKLDPLDSETQGL
jgi:hypothetical protein